MSRTGTLTNIALLERELGHVVYLQHFGVDSQDFEADALPALRERLLERIHGEHARLEAMRATDAAD